jgi:simple sugar transport system substrate-binding protein
MNKKTFTILMVIVLALVSVVPLGVTAQDEETRVFYWISHGQAGDAIWDTAIAAAERAGEDLGVEVRTSFHSADVPSHIEAFQAAIAAGADGIATSAPAPDALIEVVAQAKEAGIPVVFFNTDDPNTARDAYVGGDLMAVGQSWANYLVDNGLVESGDFVYMPVEVPGASYQVLETEGIASVFDPLGIEYEVVDAKYDQAQASVNLTDYLVANIDDVDAIIALGDIVAAQISFVFGELGVEPGTIPVVGWGNSAQTAQAVKDGYVNAATFQFPDAQGYMPIVILNQAADGQAIGYDILTFALYDAASADFYIELFSQ